MNWTISPEQVFACSPIVPVMIINKITDAVPMAKALAAGGINVFEVTLRTEVALDAIRAIVAAMPEAMVGAGTIINTLQYDAAVAAGAKFIISPGYSNTLLAHGKTGTHRRYSRRAQGRIGQYSSDRRQACPRWGTALAQPRGW